METENRLNLLRRRAFGSTAKFGERFVGRSPNYLVGQRWIGQDLVTLRIELAQVFQENIVFADAVVTITGEINSIVATRATAIPPTVEFFMRHHFFLSWRTLGIQVDLV